MGRPVTLLVLCSFVVLSSAQLNALWPPVVFTRDFVLNDFFEDGACITTGRDGSNIDDRFSERGQVFQTCFVGRIDIFNVEPVPVPCQNSLTLGAISNAAITFLGKEDDIRSRYNISDVPGSGSLYASIMFNGTNFVLRNQWDTQTYIALLQSDIEPLLDTTSDGNRGVVAYSKANIRDIFIGRLTSRPVKTMDVVTSTTVLVKGYLVDCPARFRWEIIAALPSIPVPRSSSQEEVAALAISIVSLIAVLIAFVVGIIAYRRLSKRAGYVQYDK